MVLKLFRYFILLLSFSFVWADLYSSSFEGLYRNKYHQRIDFKDSQQISLVNSTTYRLMYSHKTAFGGQASSQSVNQEYANNFRFFIPQHTIDISVKFLRHGSNGWIDGFMSYGKTPSLGKFQGTTTIPVYASGSLGADYVDNVNKIVFSAKGKDSFYKKTNDWMLKLQEYTIRYWASTGLVYHKSNIHSQALDPSIKYNKWLYFATDTRPSHPVDLSTRSSNADYSNKVKELNFDIQIFLDKAKVDSHVATYGLEAKFGALCSTYPDNTKNACIYLKSFGPDGDDDNAGTHGITAQVFEQNMVSASTTSVAIPQGWSIVGPHAADVYNLGSTFNLSQINSIHKLLNADYWHDNLPGGKLSSILRGEGVWVNAKMLTEAKFIDFPAGTSNNVRVSIKKGWNLLSTPNEITYISRKFSNNACVDAVYAYKNDNWEVWDKESTNNNLTTLSKNSGFYIKANSDCQISF